MTPPTVVFYISGHGFGHASRVVEVINALLERRPDVNVEVRTSASRWLFDLTVRRTVRVSPCECDVGVVQRDSLHPDIEATGEAAEAFYASLGPRAHREARLLLSCRPALVVADIPPLAFAAAALAGVPAVALANFTWDWIYDEYASDWGDARWVPDLIRQVHRSAREAWRLPMFGGFDGFERITDLPFVARRSGRGRDDTRRALGVGTDDPVALVSFGGFGLEGLPLGRVARDSRVTVVTTDVPGHVVPTGATEGPLARRTETGVVAVNEHALYASGWRYEDLVAAADVVVTKPGYGIIAECIANGAAILYTERGRFAEYDVLVREMPRYLRQAFISRDDLLGGTWSAGLEAALAAPAPAEHPRLDGAHTAAERIATYL